MRRVIIFLSLAALAPMALGQPGTAVDEYPRVEFEGRYWILDSTLRAKIKAASLGTEIDFKKDLGITDSNAPDVRVAYRTSGGSLIRFGYMQVPYDADSQVTRTVEFDNRIYQVGTRVVSHLDFRELRFSYGNPFIRAARGKFRIGPLTEGIGLSYDASLAAPALNFKEQDRRWVGYPAAGFCSYIRPHDVANIFLEASGMTLGKYGYIINWEGGVRVLPHKFVSITAGYRFLRLNPKLDPDYANIRLAGPFAGATFQFGYR